MTWCSDLNETLAHLLVHPAEIIRDEQLVQCIDLTLLDKKASKEALGALNHLANTQQVAAVCVFPHALASFKLQNSVKLATVTNFPQGNEDIALCLEQIKHAMCYKVQEIDYVLPYTSYLAGKKQQAIHHAAHIVQFCKEYDLTLKVILETGAFSAIEMLYDVANELIELDIDFLKTSTGAIAQGASLTSVFTLLSAIKNSGKKIGLKVSGGIKIPQQARNYAYLAQLILNQPLSNDWFRIGASSLLEQLIKK